MAVRHRIIVENFNFVTELEAADFVDGLGCASAVFLRSWEEAKKTLCS